MMKQLHFVLGCLVLYGLCLQGSAAETNSLRVRLSFGQRETKRTTYSVRLLPGSPGVKVSAMHGVGLKADDVVNDRAVLHAGAGDVRAIECDVTMPALMRPPRKIHETWEHLLRTLRPMPRSVCATTRRCGTTPRYSPSNFPRMAREAFLSDSSNCVSTKRCGSPRAMSLLPSPMHQWTSPHTSPR